MDPFTTLEAAELAGVTYRQIDYWDRASIVKPSAENARGSGSKRRYTMLDVLALALVASVTRAGGRAPRDAKVVAASGRPLAVLVELDSDRPRFVPADEADLPALWHEHRAVTVVDLDAVRLRILDRAHRRMAAA